jgi:hypothetical protein
MRPVVGILQLATIKGLAVTSVRERDDLCARDWAGARECREYSEVLA